MDSSPSRATKQAATGRETRSLDVPPLPSALSSRSPAAWLTLFGPGAVIASLTIGTGELIFSSRGGALFGYRILFLFVAICALKWTLVFTTARHMVVTGVHPFRRWMEFPCGPRGWLPSILFFFAVLCIPIWVSFHCSVLGDLLAGLTGTRQLLGGAAVHLWGAAMLAAVVGLSMVGGYAALERIQLIIVVVLLAAVAMALVMLRPDWWDLITAALVPQRLEYPQWLLSDTRPEIQRIAARPVWVETTLYVGVIGGSSYDYLAYTSFLRDKHWGLAGSREWDGRGVDASDPASASLRKWIRAPLIDCTVSFLVVLAFSAVFVTSGALVLGPQRELPSDPGFLDHQAQFVTQLSPALYPLYVVGAFLAMLGTLYGTLEVAPVILREMVIAIRGNVPPQRQVQLRRWALTWCAGGAAVVLVASFFSQLARGADRPAGLTNLLIPANLFTGVLACGLICHLNLWMDRILPAHLKPPRALTVANFLAGLVFLALGLKGYWDHSGVTALMILAATVAVGGLIAPWLARLIGAEPR
jgi:hypothetical protein